MFNAPANNSYQKELNNTTKKIAKISGIHEIEERLRVLKMILLISFDDFESSVKQLNDDRKEIGLRIRKLRQTTPKNLPQIDITELFLDYDLTLTIQKKEKHKIVVCGKEHTANIKVYKFEQLDKDTKLEVLRIIEKKFKKEYLENSY